MGKFATFTRRAALLGSIGIGGGVAFGYYAYRKPYANPLLRDADAQSAVLTPYVVVDASGITVITPRAEMGQGVHTTLAALVAEELGVTLADVRVVHGPAAKAYYNAAIAQDIVPFAPTDEGAWAERARRFTAVPAKFLGAQITGGSSSTPDGFTKMRKAGAAAREVLLVAGARLLGAPVAALTLSGAGVSDADGNVATYADLAQAARDIDVPDDPALTPPAQWRLLGRAQPRVDVPAKSTGTAQFSIDVRLPDMLYATVRMNPHLGGTLNSFDATAARQMRGVKKVIALDGGITVIATNTWYALQAAEAVVCDWADAPYPADSVAHFDVVEQAFDGAVDSVKRDDGDVETALQGSVPLAGSYQVPYLAHATMEPMNAVARLRADGLEIWAGTQNPTQVLKDAAAITGLDEDSIRVHTTYLGGGFGRRAEMDFIKYAVQIAAALPGVPVKTTWSREQDMQHDAYRPLAMARFRATVNDDGKPQALDLQLAAPSVLDSQLGRMGQSIPGADMTIVQGAWEQPYAMPHYRVRGYRAAPLLPISSWRSVGASQNGFFHESVIDEMAHAANADPLMFRLNAMTHAPSRAVLQAVATASGWGQALPAGYARGVAFVMSFGVPCAQVVEVEYVNDSIRVHQVFAAVDVGVALDPGIIEAQVQSGIVFGLSAAVSGEITVRDGIVEQNNFDDFAPLRLAQTPKIHVQILENGSRVRGVGEPGTPPAAPALANAVFAATGKRIRELPLSKQIAFS